MGVGAAGDEFGGDASADGEVGAGTCLQGSGADGLAR